MPPKRRPNPLRYIVRVFGLLALLVGLAVCLFVGWFYLRPQPTPVTDQVLFPGVTYTREVTRDPRPLIAHIVTIDLNTAGLRFLVTPPDEIADASNNRVADPPYDYVARTVQEYVAEFDLQLAINGDFFQPWRDHGPQDYYPHTGEPVRVNGLTISEGELVTSGYGRHYHTLYLTEDNQATFTRPNAPIDNAISGNTMVVVDGVYNTRLPAYEYRLPRHPRTAVALDASGDTLLLFIVDGRQPNYSDGVTLPELAEIILRHGGHSALNLDGGGSAALVVQQPDGALETLNTPIHNRIPHRQRPVANHLGIAIDPSHLSD